MLYLLLCSMTMGLAVLACLDHIFKSAAWASNPDDPRPAILPVFGLIAIGCLFSAPMLVTVFDAVAHKEAQLQGDTNWMVYLVLAGSILSFVLATGLARKVIDDRKLPFWTGGKMMVLVLAGIVGTVSAYKHLSYFKGQDVAVIYLGALKKIADVSDMPGCTGIALAKIEQSGAMDFRCPKVLMMNQLSHTPFVPWPDYIEGSSTQLGEVIRTVKASSTELSPEDDAG